MRNTFHLNTMIKQRRRMQVVQPKRSDVGEAKDVEERVDAALEGLDDDEVENWW